MRTGPEMLRKRGDLACKKVDRMSNIADMQMIRKIYERMRTRANTVE